MSRHDLSWRRSRRAAPNLAATAVVVLIAVSPARGLLAHPATSSAADRAALAWVGWTAMVALYVVLPDVLADRSVDARGLLRWGIAGGAIIGADAAAHVAVAPGRPVAAAAAFAAGVVLAFLSALPRPSSFAACVAPMASMHLTGVATAPLAATYGLVMGTATPPTPVRLRAASAVLLVLGVFLWRTA